MAQAVSLNQFSNIAKVSKGYLSKIENLQFEIDDELLHYLFKKLDINFVYDQAQLNENDALLEEFYIALVFYDIEKAEQLYQKIDERKEDYIESVLLLKYYLYSFIWNSIHKMDLTKTEEILNILEKDIRSFVPFDNRELQIFLDTKGYCYMLQHSYKEAIKLLKRALALGTNQYSYGMTCYHLASVLAFDNNLVDAMKYANLALDEFTKELNFKRQWFTQTHIANIYVRIKQYETAEEIYRNMLKYFSNINDKFMWDKIRSNLCWVLILQEKYNESLAFIINSNNQVDYQMDIFHVALCYYNLHEYKESLNWIEKGKVNCKNNIVVYEKLRVLEILINEKDDIEVLAHIKESYSKALDKLNYEGNTFYLELLIEYSEKTFKYKEALDYMRKLVEL